MLIGRRFNMIKINNIDKYFNRHKRNEIHVINHTSLELDDRGLVALLGPSGSGKTTLLNVIGGLDKVRSGDIFINGKKITRFCQNKVDEIRNLNIGYVFQDYKLVEDMSVYDNVSLVLKMIGIKDKKEIDKRVCYVLEKVGMLRYKRRPCSMLSGGERQRVGIARAIVKNPDIIIADEPTGNLDSKNSLEIMKIIRAISKDRLVILVTHEVDLAKFYATRIIEIKDGTVIKDYKNEPDDELDYRLDNTFYLKDFDNKDNTKISGHDINIYSNDGEKIKLDIVVSSGNIYIKSNSLDKVEVIDDNSSIELVDDHYKKIGKEDIDKYKFDFSNIINKDIKKKYSSILNPITLIINGFKKVFDYIKCNDLKTMECGRYEINGENLFFNLQEYETKPIQKLEAHKKYIDIQIVVSGEEYMGYCNIDKTTVSEQYDEKKDVMFLDGKVDKIYADNKTFLIFFPQDAHMPALSVKEPAHVKKAIFKIQAE